MDLILYCFLCILRGGVEREREAIYQKLTNISGSVILDCFKLSSLILSIDANCSPMFTEHRKKEQS